MSVLYVTGDQTGWLRVRRTTSNEVVSLPHLLKVRFQHTRQGRDYFQALEGCYKGENFSVARQPRGGSYLAPRSGHLVAGVIRFDRGKRQLWYGGTGPVNALTDGSTPMPLGTFDMEIPDHPHALGRDYAGMSSYAMVWFRILPGATNTLETRYLHAGRASDGCVTVNDIPRWTHIFHYLIARRKNDASVGTITVVE